MTKKIICLGSIIVASLLTFSCNKEPIVSTSKKDQSTQQIPVKMYVNGFEFDSVGAAHNGYLNFVFGNPNSGSMTDEELYDYGENYIDPNFGAMPNTPYSLVLPKVNYAISISDNLIQNGVDPTNELLQDSLIDVTMAPYSHALANILRDAADTISHNLYSPQQFDSIVGLLEQSIANNVTVSMNYDSSIGDYIGNDGAKLLATCAVAKYSYSYWYNDAIGSSGNMMTTTGTRVGSIFHRVWNGLKIAGADVYGFLASGTVSVSTSISSIQMAGNGPSVTGTWVLKDAIHDAGVASSTQKGRNK